MPPVFIGSEALARGALTRATLRWNYRRLYPDVYTSAPASLRVRTIGAWLWTRRNGIVTGRAAAALHGARWVDDRVPIEMIWKCGRPPPGVIARNERIAADEVTQIAGLLVTTPERTALDLARHLPRNRAVSHLDALAPATEVKAVDVLTVAQRYPGARGLRSAVTALSLMDGGSQSPRETSLRLLLVDEWTDPVRTQIKVCEDRNVAYIDMGYDEPMVGLDYEGAHHAEDRTTYVGDIGRAELIERCGWFDLRVVKEHTSDFIKHRVQQAFQRRGYTPTLRRRS
ncbi:type IV toxin-antitoxin system AbiEi family antitoxin [Mycolicibacterium pyrenivorans]|uniref:type IV toxin-antitoxin system AbiEi family antitoxin n=1 Tax=Mycolicibacterium pyrenivorans TaxID=187102 RepID=UPI0021F38B55|nr:type IV toxin-antitoxin system AbiEi family antitoxin [Mycolicibacterium pyrenivorans]MCV7149920.1 hypothetical protein [Mycolicibacterium pyrenivorans]